MRLIVRCVNDHFIVYFIEIESSLPTFVNILANIPNGNIGKKSNSALDVMQNVVDVQKEQLLLTGIAFSSFLLLLLF
ncbi:hypothetical protein T11_3740 [Trichinella zimbabwensis]|uniref:Uncharacterized protein n=1 Tax=Trichinella zimbabwensis TaxID=268475 RepID=A0A0V1HKS6_9BILA|nr:hypothetical protein T11_3740 [Trichinella zimbabwensis]